MNTALYNCIRKKYGKHASWAIWDKKNTGEWADREYRQIINSGRKLNPNIVMVGLNASANVSVTEEDLFSNFHEPKNSSAKNELHWKTRANARKLPCVFCGTPCEGAYMTDIIKPGTISKIAPEKLPSSGDIMKYMKANPKILEKNISSFREELKCIGADNPQIIAFGSSASKILLKFGIKHIRIPHYSYSKYGDEELYRKAVAKILKGLLQS